MGEQLVHGRYSYFLHSHLLNSIGVLSYYSMCSSELWKEGGQSIKIQDSVIMQN